MAKSATTERLIAENRRARYDYFIEERLEAGLVLEGWEVKSMRAGRAQLAEAYVYVRNGEAFLIGAHLVTPAHHLYPQGGRPGANAKTAAAPERDRPALAPAERRGYTLVPLELYWKQWPRQAADRYSPRARSSTTSAPPRRSATGSATSSLLRRG